MPPRRRYEVIPDDNPGTNIHRVTCDGETIATTTTYSLACDVISRRLVNYGGDDAMIDDLSGGRIDTPGC